MVSTKAFDMIYRAIYCIVAYILFVPSNGRGHILWLTENTLSTPDLYHKNLYLRAGVVSWTMHTWAAARPGPKLSY